MKIIVCNIGSSSFKFQLLDMTTESQIALGYIERVGSENAIIYCWFKNEQVLSAELPIPTHREAVQQGLNFLTGAEHSILRNLDEIDGIGFKCIQAGEKNGSVPLSQDVLDAMEYYR